MFIGLKSNKKIKISNFDDARKYKIAVLRDDISHHLLLSKGFIEKKNLFVVNNTRSLLKLLLMRESIDLIITDESSINYRAKYNNIDPNLFKSFYKINKEPLNFHFACSKQTDPSVISNLSSAIATIKRNGKYQEIMNKWKDK